jgi:hypothetical protein
MGPRRQSYAIAACRPKLEQGGRSPGVIEADIRSKKE